MDKNRLLELAGISQVNELDQSGIESNQMHDTIESLRAKLKETGVNTTGLSDEFVLKFANAMKEINIR